MSIKMSKLVGLDGPFSHEGPYPSIDHCGYEVACNMLLYSRRSGKYDKDYTQFDGINDDWEEFNERDSAAKKGSA